MKLIDPKITVLINADGATIEIYDTPSSTMLIEVKLTNDQLASALSRLSHTPCEASVYGLDKIGKKHENTSFEFEIPEGLGSANSSALNQLCLKALKAADMEDWKPDSYFGSQDSFFKKEGKNYARAIIRRWI